MHSSHAEYNGTPMSHEGNKIDKAAAYTYWIPYRIGRMDGDGLVDHGFDGSQLICHDKSDSKEKRILKSQPTKRYVAQYAAN